MNAHLIKMNARLIKSAVACALCIFWIETSPAQFIPPLVTSVTAMQNTSPSQTVTISFSISDANPNATVDNVAIIVSSDGGNTWTVPAVSFAATSPPPFTWVPGAPSGQVAAFTTAKTCTATWNAGADWATHYNSACKVRVIAWNNAMAFIPSGSYTRGNSVTGTDPAGYAVNGADPDIATDINSTSSDASAYPVYVTGFLMDSNLVTGGLWNLVYGYATANGYTFDNPGSSQGNNFPVQGVDWYDAIKWCNARSQMESLTPVYYTDNAYQNNYTGSPTVDVDAVYANPNANGYRLPTEAEWEKAARGGQVGKRFPWGDEIQQPFPAGSGDEADYTTTIWLNELYDSGYSDRDGYIEIIDGQLINPPENYYPPYTALVGSFPANGYGLYDMAGNVEEWCWDWYGSTYYAAGQVNPQGPSSSSDTTPNRVQRGGGWEDTADILRCARRGQNPPAFQDYQHGFRCVREASSFVTPQP